MFPRDFLTRIKVRALRRVLRGYRVLKQSDRIWKVNAVHEELITTKCANVGGYSKTIFGVAVTNVELAVRQYLLMRLTGLRLRKAILYAHGKPDSSVIYPLPPEWRRVLKQHGFSVANFRSAVCWNALVIFFIARGIWSIGQQLFRGIREIYKLSFPILGRYVFFSDLSPNNLPLAGHNGSSHDIISWYQQWEGRTKEIDVYCHTVKDSPWTTTQGGALITLRSAIPPLFNLATLLRYFSWGVAAGTIAIADFIRGRWWSALMLSEVSKAAVVRMLQSDRLASDYLFHNSGWIYRPLWTYDAEKKGSRIIFYFYSTNCEVFKLPGRDATRDFWGYKAMAWPYYLVWDEYQENFVRRMDCGHPRIDAVGPIRFTTSALNMPRLPLKTVAVFDVQPFRGAFYKTLTLEFDYYTPETANQFLVDIYEVLKDFDCSLALKRKREIGKQAHPAYMSLIKRIEGSLNFVHIDPSITATAIIQNCIAIVSAPFTSTAILGRESGKPSIYYDPRGLVQKGDPAAHGIQILSGQEELRCWIASVVDKTT